MSMKCAVLVNSCDKYSDIWAPFFSLFFLYWPECKYNVFLCTETKTYVNHNHCVKTLNYNSNQWGKRLKECIRKIDSDYVIMLLDDFFFQRMVNDGEIEKCISIMDNNPNLVAIYFKIIDGFQKGTSFCSNYIFMNEKKRYLLNLQASIWRKRTLLELIDDNDNPWSFEEEGCLRVDDQLFFLCSKHGTHTQFQKCVFPYLTARNTGYGVWNGKLLWKNKILFKKNGVDFQKCSLPIFTRLDLLKHYVKRLKEKVGVIKRK